ncbi:FtsX-like permease family protein [Acrocarpospora sp. B8E8]|uniref:FtsX-like permease family protein n=1 Tax=Acrocarpospora sp. B8E8 TaxID=3153572 RepID=UPI00325EC6E3
MTALWLRLESRRRWRALVALALLVAIATATVLAAVAGARRGASALERLLAVTLPATVAVLPNEPGFDWDRVRAMPGVEAVGTFVSTPFVTAGRMADAEQGAFFPPGDRGLGQTLERPVVLAGRLADPDRFDEVMVTPRYLEANGKDVGDTMTIALLTPEQMDREDSAALTPAGPRVQARIVGVVRSFFNTDSAEGGTGLVLTTPALFERYTANFMGASNGGFVNAAVRLTDGEAGLPAFVKALGPDIEVWSVADAAMFHQRIAAFESAALLVFALVALIAAVVLVGQSVSRLVAASGADLRAMRDLGLTSRQAIAAGSAGPLLAAVAGASLGVGGAVVASFWLPIGAAALTEPEPGIDVDWLVLAPGWAAVVTAVAVRAAAATWVATVRARSGRQMARRSPVASAAARWGLPVPVAVGLRFALEPGHGRQAVPVRPALLGAVVGVLGVLAAFTVADGVADAIREPARFGQTHRLTLFFGFNGEGAPSRPVIEALLRDPDVAGVNDAKVGVAASGDMSFPMFTLDPYGRWPDVALTEGTAPRGPDEIVLAPVTATDLRAGVGGSIRLTSTGKTEAFRVTGIGLLPEGPHNGYVNGAWVAPEGYARLFAPGEFKFHLGLVALRPGADAVAAGTRLGAAAGKYGVTAEPTGPLPQALELRNVRLLPILLAGFLILLAVGAVGHVLATAIRRRRHELSVLRALGMTRGQARGVVVTQAVVLAAVGLSFGVPLGVTLGRTVWRIIADTMPLLYQPPLAVVALVLVVPLALLVVCAAALWPARQAARLRVGVILRAE